MFESFKKGHLKFLVGVCFDDRNEKLLSYAMKLAEKTGAKLRLTHVVGPGTEFSWVSSVYGGSVYQPLAKEIQEQTFKESYERLMELHSKIKGLGEVETNISMGTPPEVLSADAVASGASLILVGTRINRAKFLPKGFSTSLSLMTHASRPVMTVPDDVRSVRESGNLKVLYADDLTDHSRDALTVGFEMAYGLENTDFYHLHICEVEEEDLKETQEKMSEMMVMERIPYDEHISKSDPVGKARTKIKEKMNLRLGGVKFLLQAASCSYIQKIYFGDVQEQLHKAVEEIDPDILVFGKHSFLHRKPFGIGKLPFSAMLSQNRTIVIAPGKKAIVG
ncbi:MAG: universal stress protein [Deltaproteobacteria bacterium]|nr:universal stress protein [Deltaproteobacteria bacterium]